ncbi:hypothetical protein [Pedobacter sp. Leaf176]|uniref:hypothetical protein n=1 Tax=Pedobacter sp. Leaf176 TaxID=1736286 RepID=UPI0006FCE9D4|nr:hypothetical protein [Pedobacter sp. Leaf176]KQR72198.1 hypothetical protein ASF92_02545 [Pedobacter sp. Leaf176]
MPETKFKTNRGTTPDKLAYKSRCLKEKPFQSTKKSGSFAIHARDGRRTKATQEEQIYSDKT